VSNFTISGVFKGAAIGGAIGGVGNVLLYLAGGAAGAAYLMAPPGGGEPAPIPLAMPFIMTLVPGLLGAAILAGLLKFVPARAWTIFLVISALVFLAMLPGPVMQMGDDTVAVVVLEIMHLVAAAGVIGGIHTLGRGAQ
jgi:hypothetical protein